MEVLKKIKIELLCDPAILLLGIYLEKMKKKKKKQFQRYMHPNVHRSIIYNRQDMEAA